MVVISSDVSIWSFSEFSGQQVQIAGAVKIARFSFVSAVAGDIFSAIRQSSDCDVLLRFAF
jgi:hypothetical protein